MLSKCILGLAGVLLLMGMPVQAEVVMEWVTVGDPGNASDTRYETPGYGAVDYVYHIGRYEVTNAQYAEFLNAVAAEGDPNWLYSTHMGGGWNDIGGISRSGSGTEVDPWVYAARPDRANRPVNYVRWDDAARFANWMHNGQPTGAQDASTTEDGAYDMSLWGPGLVRKDGAKVFVPSEDEWYKAAYYKGGGANAGYWDYPTQTDDPNPPTPEAPPGTDMLYGSANYDCDYPVCGGRPYYVSVVGAYDAMPSVSAYGTFDQGGNVREWNEGYQGVRGVRGASFGYPFWYLHAAERMQEYPESEYYDLGFRVAHDAYTDITYFRVEHNVKLDRYNWPDPPSGSMTSTNRIEGWYDSDSGSDGTFLFWSHAEDVDSKRDVLRVNLYDNCTMNQGGGWGNNGTDALGYAEWVANDLVFTGMDGQTGGVPVTIRANLCVSHGGACTAEIGACQDGFASQLTGGSAVGNAPEFFSFSYRAVSQGGSGIPGGPGEYSNPDIEPDEPAEFTVCIDVADTVEVELDRTYTWGPYLEGQLKTAVGTSGHDQTDDAFMNAMLCLGNLPGRGATDGVFILPPGITVNAPSIGLVDNKFVPDGPAAIPTTSEWGMAALTLLLLGVGGVVIAKRRMGVQA